MNVPAKNPKQGISRLWSFLKAGYALGASSESARIRLNKWFYFIHLQHEFGHVRHGSCRVNVGEFYKFDMVQNFLEWGTYHKWEITLFGGILTFGWEDAGSVKG